MTRVEILLCGSVFGKGFDSLDNRQSNPSYPCYTVSVKRIVYSDHARHQLVERHMDTTTVEQMLESPDAVLPAAKGRQIAQKLLHRGGQQFLYRVVFADEGSVRTVITVYRTSKAGKYAS